MRARTVAGLGLAALLSAGCGLGEDTQIRQERVEFFNKAGISTELIERYEQLGLSLDDVGITFGRAKATPEIVKHLLEKEDLTAKELSSLVWTGHVKNKVQFEGPMQFNGEEYQRWSAQGFSLAVYGASKANNVSLEAAIDCTRLGFAPKNQNPYDMDGFVRLAAHRVSCDAAAKQGLDVDAIVKTYSDAVGTTPQNRVKYLKLGYEDSQIKVLAARGLYPDLVDRLTRKHEKDREYQEYREIKPLDKQEILRLAASGKLTGDIYQQWINSEFKPIEAIYVLRNGYDLKKAKDWRAAGWGLDEMVECEKVGINLYMALEIKRTTGLNPFEAANVVKGQKILAMYPDLAKQ